MQCRCTEPRDAPALIASHAVLETARDALFLAKVPAAHLPWVFLGIAALSVLLAKFQSTSLKPARALSVITLIAAVVTAGFYALIEQARPRPCTHSMFGRG